MWLAALAEANALLEVVQQSPLIALLDATEAALDATEAALDATEAEGGAERAALLLQDALVDAFGGAAVGELEHLAPEEKRRRARGVVEQVIVEGAEASLVCALTGRRDPLDVHHRYSTSSASGRMDRPVRHASNA
jgi:hypothetical protein